MFSWFWLIILWVKEAVTGLFRNSWLSLMSLFLSLACLIVFAVSFISGLNAEYISQVLDQKVEIQVDLLDGVTNYDAVQNQIKQIPGVKAVSFVSKDEAYKRMEQEMGADSDVLHSLDQNPFPARVVVNLVDPNKVTDVVGAIKSMNVAESVEYGKDYVDRLISFTKLIQNVGYVVTGFATIFTIFVVVITIRNNITQRSQEIQIKQLVGAGMLTVRIPFIIEAILLTAISGFATYFLISYGYGKLIFTMQQVAPYAPLLSPSEILQKTFLPLVSLAVSIGFVGSVLSTKKFLQKY